MVGTLRIIMDKEDFLAAALRNPVNEAIADELFRLALPDAWIVSGCLVQTAWNVQTIPALHSSAQGIDRFLTKNTQVGIRRTPSGHDVYAPNGFDDIADMVVRPNHTANFSAANYEAKASRWKALWPEIAVLGAETG